MPSRKSHAQLLRKTGGVGLSFLGVFSLADGEKFSLRATLHRFFPLFSLPLSHFILGSSLSTKWSQQRRALSLHFCCFSFFLHPTDPTTVAVGGNLENAKPPTTLRGVTFSREFRSITGRRITASSGAWKCYMFTFPAFSVFLCVWVWKSSNFP